MVYELPKLNCIHKRSAFYTCFTKEIIVNIHLLLTDYGEYSLRLRLGEYSPIITSASAKSC